MKPCFVLVAGEASGDRLGASIIQALRTLFPAATFTGVPGPLMRQAGCQAFFPQEELAVMGFVDVLKHLPTLLKRRLQLLDRVSQLTPEVYIGLDAPDFNLPIEKKLKKQGIKTVHVNSPTVWAWRPGRLKHIAASVDLMLLLFPFEQAIYQQAAIPAAYIGHPLADELPVTYDQAAMKKALNIAPQTPMLALLPGSRASELRYLAATFIHVAERCMQHVPNMQCYVPLINEKSRRDFVAYWQAEAPHIALHCTIGNAHQVMQAADVVLVASGTASLEALLCQKPMVVAYRMHPFNYFLAKCLIKTPYVSLPNILAQQALVPERIQHQASVQRLSRDVLAWFDDEKRRQDISQRFTDMHLSLRQDAAQKAATAIAQLILP